MVFNDDDNSKGFWTFKECLDASKNPEKDFTYSFEESKHSKDIDKTEKYAMNHIDEMELY